MRALRLLLLIAALVPSLAWSADQFYVIVGSYDWRETADGATAGLQRATGAAVLVLRAEQGGEERYRIATGPFATYEAASDALAHAQEAGIEAAWILSAEPETVSTAARDPEVAANAPEQTGQRREEEVPAELRSREILVRRGVPEDLTRSVRVEVTEASAERYMRTQGETTGKILPPPPEEGAARLARMGEVQLADIRVNGGKLMANELEKLIAPLRNSKVTASELLNLKDEINRRFVAQGYINSGVIIPDQKIENGVVAMNLVEGRLGQINVDGPLRASFVRKRIDAGTPFNLKELQESLKLLEKHPLIDRIKARIEPGGELGVAVLDLSVDTPPFYLVGVRAANNGSPSIGSKQGEVYFQSENLTTFGDTLRLSRSITEGLDAWQADFAIPINAHDWSLFVGKSVTNSTVIEEPFDAVDIKSETESVRFGLDIPLRRTTTSSLSLQISAEKRRNYTELLGQSFSFSEGAVDGESKVAPVRVALSWLTQGASQSMGARLVISKGTDRFDATKNATGPDGDFLSYLGIFQMSRRLTENWSATTRMLVQRTSDPLLAIERMAVGGIDSVRGYRENQLVRDEVELVSAEARYRLPVERARTEFVTFYDWGGGANHEGSASTEKDAISSVGVGFAYRGKALHAELYWAHPFDDIPQQTSDLQDKGIHFRASYEYRF